MQITDHPNIFTSPQIIHSVDYKNRLCVTKGTRRKAKTMEGTYRARRNRETPEEREERLARHREYERCRYAALTVKQHCNLPQRRGERQLLASETHQAEDPSDNNHGIVRSNLPPFDDPSIVSKVAQFHNELMSLAFNKCTVCLKSFPSLKINTCAHQKAANHAYSQ